MGFVNLFEGCLSWETVMKGAQTSSVQLKSWIHYVSVKQKCGYSCFQGQNPNKVTYKNTLTFSHAPYNLYILDFGHSLLFHP